MAKEFWVTFGSGAAETNTGLTPTFTQFRSFSGTISSPSISELAASSGCYGFTFTPLATMSIFFQLDGGSGLGTSDRYVQGVIDPLLVVDQRLGTTSDSIGSTSVDPSTIFGYVMRHLEFLEGNASFTKATGLWDIYSRGSSTLLREKALTNNSSSATKT